jgi:hypothetical protein
MTDTDGVALLSAVRRLVVANDGDGYVLGRPDLAVYVVVPEPGAVFVHALQAGESIAVATARASEAAGAEVDGEDFLAGLAAAGLLEETTTVEGRGREIRWVEWVSPAAARRLFGPVAWSGYGLAAAFVVGALVVRPDLWPSYEHTWWLPDPVLSVLLLFPVGLLLSALHEAWHWLAGRALGVPAVFRVSYRGIFLVFETDLTQIVTVARRRRYGPFLAGMAFDITVLAAALALRLMQRTGLLILPGWLDRLLAAVVLVQIIGIVWQWTVLFMRTDAYAVLANALRCHDLYRATWLTTKDRLWRLTDADAGELAGISEHDRRVAGWFALLYLAGLIAMGWLLLTFAIPFMVSMVSWVGHNLSHPSLGTLAFWESVAVLAIVVGRYAVVPLLAMRERRLRRTGGLR